MPGECSGGGNSRAVVTLSVGERPFMRVTRPLLELYASKLGAALHAVLSLLHICLLFIQATPPAACSLARDASDRLQPLVATAQSLLQRLSPTPPTSSRTSAS